MEQLQENGSAARKQQKSDDATGLQQQLAAAAERQLVAAAAELSRSSGSAVTRLSYKSRSTRPGEISRRLAARLDRRNFLVYQGWMKILLT